MQIPTLYKSDNSVRNIKSSNTWQRGWPHRALRVDDLKKLDHCHYRFSRFCRTRASYPQPMCLFWEGPEPAHAPRATSKLQRVAPSCPKELVRQDKVSRSAPQV